MAAPQKDTDAFIITKKLFLGGLRGLQSNSIWYETPCIKVKFFNADVTDYLGIIADIFLSWLSYKQDQFGHVFSTLIPKTDRQIDFWGRKTQGQKDQS